MDAKSGVFTAPLGGAYPFTVNVCSHDMKKVLIAIRKNGQEIASVYDQVSRDSVMQLQLFSYTHINILIESCGQPQELYGQPDSDY